MKTKTKKIIAREVLLLTSIIPILLLIWGGIALYNYNQHQTIEQLRSELDSLENKILILEEGRAQEFIDEEANDKETVTEEFNNMDPRTITEEQYLSLKKGFIEDPRFDQLTDDGKKLSLENFYRKFTVPFMQQQGVIHPQRLEILKTEFVNDMMEIYYKRINTLDLDTIKYLVSLKKQTSEIAKYIERCNSSLHNIHDFLYHSFLLLLIILYPLRLLILGLIWSVKTLRS